jgi:lysophospholipase L1-like esterase
MAITLEFTSLRGHAPAGRGCMFLAMGQKHIGSAKWNWAGCAFALVILLVWTVWAQQPAATPTLQEREGAATAPRPASDQPLTEWQQQHARLFATDFADLARYRPANQALHPASVGDNRVIFFGDSITDRWNLDQFFPGKGYINRGISGQTTSQMLLRFRQDVIDLRPRVVVVLAGTNDIAGNTGPIALKDIEANLASMAELARTHHVSVIFSSVTPVNNYVPEWIRLYNQRPAAEIIDLNAWMKDYCASNGYWYLDYFNPLLDDKGMLKRNLSDDGLHPNDAGYKIMTPLAEAAIEKAVAR